MCSSHQELNGADSISSPPILPAKLKKLDENKSIYFHPIRIVPGFHCVGCGNAVWGFMDGLSLKEFSLSQLCQDCQDDVFSEKYEDDPDFDDNEWVPYHGDSAR